MVKIQFKLFIVCFVLLGSIFVSVPFSAPLRAQIGVDFNQGNSSGSLNLTSSYRLYHDFGGIVPGKQSSLHFGLNGFFWLSRKLSTRFSLGAGLPLLGAKSAKDVASDAQYFYEGEFALRFTLLKANAVVMMLGAVVEASEGHSGDALLLSPEAASVYMQTGLGLEFEMAFALSLEYLLYLRLKVPVSTYNAVAGKPLQWGFYPRQGSLELAFLFHKGPSFGLSKAARNIYFGPFYRFDVRMLHLPPATLIMSHTIGFSYYIKPPF